MHMNVRSIYYSTSMILDEKPMGAWAHELNACLKRYYVLVNGRGIESYYVLRRSVLKQ